MSLKAIIYTRVSSDQQVDNTSLDQQERQARDYCKRQNFDVVQVFREEGVSARLEERPALNAALKFCEKNKPDYFVVYKLDRFARAVRVHENIKALLSLYGTRLISVTEHIENSTSGIFLEQILAAASEFENRRRRDNCLDGVYATIKNGYWPYRAPIGYIKDKSKNNLLVPDPRRYDLLQEAWQRMLTGKYRSLEVLEWLNSHGFETTTGQPLYRQKYSKILHNILYAGILDAPQFDLRVQGNHQPMISEGEFYKVQDILLFQAQGKKGKHLTFNPDFTLNKNLFCSTCGHKLTGGWSRGKLGKLYPYYRCHYKECPLKDNLKRDEVEGAFVNFLDTRIKFIPEVSNYLYTLTISKYEVYLKGYIAKRRPIESQIKALEEKLKRLEYLLEEGVYTVDQFKQKTKDVNIQLKKLEIDTTEIRLDIDDLDRMVAEDLDYLQHISKHWIELSPKDKDRLVKFIMPNGVTYSNYTIATPKLNPFVELYGGSVTSQEYRIRNRGHNYNSILDFFEQFNSLIKSFNVAL